MSDRSSCKVEPDVLSAFMDEQLPGDRMEELRDHVRTCDRCSKRLSRLRETQRVARTVEAPSAPDEFVSDVRERIEVEAGAEQASFQGDGSSAELGGRSAPSGEGAGSTTEESDSLLSNPMGLAAAAVLLIGVTVGLLTVLQQSTKRSANKVVSNEEQLDRSAKSASEGERVISEDKAHRGSSSESNSAEEQLSETSSTSGVTKADAEEPSAETAGSGGGLAGDFETSEGKTAPSEDDTRYQKKKTARADSSENRDLQENVDNLKQEMDLAEPDLSPVLVRLRGKRELLLKELTSALSALDSRDVALRAHFFAEPEEQSKLAGADDDGGENAGETKKKVRKLSLDTSPEQLSALLEQNATLELVTRGDEPKLFLGALVQQGQSPAVLSTKPEVFGGRGQFSTKSAFMDSSDAEESKNEGKQDAGQKDGSFSRKADKIRRSLVVLQQSNIRLQRSRMVWEEEAKDRKTTSKASGSPVTGDAISVPALRRFLRRYQDSTDETDGKEADQDQVKSAFAEQQTDPGTDANERRDVLREWVSFLEKNPSSWSATNVVKPKSEVKTASPEKEEETRSRLANQKQRLNKDYLDIHLRIQDSVTPAQQQQMEGVQKQDEK